jgi:hypothetical protein
MSALTFASVESQRGYDDGGNDSQRHVRDDALASDEQIYSIKSDSQLFLARRKM